MAKRKGKISFTEPELQGLLADEHARGYKQGVAVGRSCEQPAIETVRTRVETLEVMLAGTAPAAAALAVLATGKKES
jgi:hypothetical protein